MQNLEIEYVDINSIRPYEKNARQHSKIDVAAIVKSINEFGFNDPIGVWQNIIVEGHGRLLAAKELGMNKVPVIRLDNLTDDQRRAYALAHNKTAELSLWDLEVLADELKEISDINMADFGFDLAQLSSDEDMAPEEDELFDDIDKLETHYGVPYQGNKSRIADIIISILPPSNRLVDLFGGGGAITHCAILSGKWENYLYNDLNEMITGLFIDAVHGKYHDENRVITREDFEQLKDTDAYVKYIWSFGNNGQTYLWGKDIEAIKCQACRILTAETIKTRRTEYARFIHLLYEHKESLEHKRRIDRLQNFENLQVLTQLEALQKLEALQRLEISNISYEQYEYHKGDVVYCDVPYEQLDKNKCDDYGVQFDSLAFYEWVKAQPYQVFFSSYEISDNSFEKVKIKAIQSRIGAKTNSKKVNEYLYSNRPIIYDQAKMEK